MKRTAQVLAAVLGGLALQAAPAAAQELKLGLIYPVSGPLAGIGAMYNPGIAYVLDKYNAAGGWNGTKVTSKIYDDAGSTTGAADRFQQAIGEGVRLFAVGSTSPVSAQILNDVKNWNQRNPNDKAVVLIVGAEATDFTAKSCYYYAFKMSTNAGIRVKALAEALKKTGKLGAKVASIQPKYTLGFDMQAAVEAGAKTYGYTLVGSLGHDYAKLHDFAPFVERLRPMGADIIFTASSITDLRLMVQAASAAALPGKFATLYLDEPGNIAAAGKSAIGSFVAQLFNAEANGEATAAYRRDFVAKSGVEPVNIVNNALISMTVLTQALNGMPKGAFSADAFVTAMEGVKADWPMGALTMRKQDHQLILPLAVSEVSEAATVKADNTTMGFKPVAVLTGEEASVPPSPECQMARP